MSEGRGVEQDKALPHQIQLVFAMMPGRPRQCLNGDEPRRADVVVTCNCWRIGLTDGFSEWLGLAPTPRLAWEVWNRADLHYEATRQSFAPHRPSEAV